jgi:hypothetical protein
LKEQNILMAADGHQPSLAYKEIIFGPENLKKQNKE